MCLQPPATPPPAVSAQVEAQAEGSWLVEQQRLDSKVRFLEGVIKTKDDQIDNLQMRVEVSSLPWTTSHIIWDRTL